MHCACRRDMSGHRKSKVIVNSAFNMFTDCLRVVGRLWCFGGAGAGYAAVACPAVTRQLAAAMSYHGDNVEKLGSYVDYQENTRINRLFPSFRRNSSVKKN